MSRKYRKWTDTEIDYLQHKRELGVTFSEIASALGRDTRQVIAEYHQMKKRYRGCDGDCENCIYEDCLMPAAIVALNLHTKEEIMQAFKAYKATTEKSNSVQNAKRRKQ